MTNYAFQDPCMVLDHSWKEHGFGNSSMISLEGLHRRALSILVRTRLTKSWRTDELPEWLNDCWEKRGVLEFIAKWRDLFWRRNLAALLRMGIEYGLPWHQQTFWLSDLPQQWLASNLLASHPPLGPSQFRPINHPYAFHPTFVEWVNTELLQRLCRLNPVLADYIGEFSYVTDNPDAFRRLGNAISIASITLLSEKLGLLEKNCEQAKVVDYLARGGEFVSFRYRGSRNMLWPVNVKRPYVDLQLEPVHAQVLLFEESEADAQGLLRRSLPLRDGGINGNDVAPSFTYLKRMDIELATWSEAMLRLLRLSAGKEAMMDNTGTDEPSQLAQGLEALAPHQRAWAQAILDACKANTTPSQDNNRFFLPGETLMSLHTGPVEISDGIRLIGPESSLPILESDVLTMRLDWSLIAPQGEWMDLHLALLLPEQLEPEWLEYREIESSNSNEENLCELKLHGLHWEAAKLRFSPLQLVELPPKFSLPRVT